ncbi:centromere protein J [Procambarus clarkii]|uniref:centromere protein J n=1 Tax=Procambarus clarkii TaxID=6728 RepID=UPI00374322CA
MISIFNAIRFISVFCILFEMENDKHGVFDQETGKNNQEKGQLNLELNVQSPSETMLERLKEIRKWQEKHREKLAQVQAFNLESPPLTSRNTQTAVPTINSDFSSQTTKDSVYFHPENTFENRNVCNLALSKFQESERVSTSGTEDEREGEITHLERGGCLKKCNARPFFSQDAINFCKSTAFIDEALTTWPPCKNTTDCVSLTSPECSLNRDTLEECETKSVEEYQEQVDPRRQISNIINVKDITPASNMNTMSNNESTKTQIASAHSNNSDQILEERQESAVYHSEKYKSNAEQKFAFLRGISEKTVSKFLSPARNPVSNIAEEYDDKPKPKHKYLRKGEGTARFGMKSMQLKKSYSSANSNNSDTINTVKRQELKIISNPDSTNVKTSITDNSAQGKNIRKTTKRPINCLQLKIPPDMTTNKFVNEVDSIACTALSNEKWQKCDKEFELVQLCPETHPNPSVSNVELYNQSLKEREELSAFEKLEELAADSSFSSNSSTVLQLLQRGLHSMASTPLHSTPPVTSQERLNCNDGEMAPKKCLFEPNTTNLNLLDRLLKSSKDYEEFSSHILQQKELNISQVLEQLRAIIELEEHDVSEAEIESFFESFGDQHASISHAAASRFACSVSHANTNATSTPALSQDVFLPKPHVHFRNEGVEVLEYELSEADEDTLTDAPTLTEEDSDLATTLDMEALAHLNLHEPLIPHSKMAVTSVNKETEECSTDKSCKSSASSKLLTNDPRQEAGLQPAVLHFSPPQQKQNSASNYIWSIFGKDRYSKRHSDQKKVSNNSERVHDSYRNEAVHKQTGKATAGPNIQEEQHSTTDEIETYKTLLLAKICELEKETKIFKKETSKLQKLQELAVDEKKQLTEERHKLQEEITREKKKFREYIDNERNAVWKEKQGLKHLSPSITMANQNSLEIVYLKEQIQDLQDNGKKKESLHQYTVKKLNEKIKNLEVENNQLKEKMLQFQSLGKENLQLKHELDRIKLTGKKVIVNKAGNTARENPRPKAKAATVNSVTRSLDKLAKIEGKGIGASNEEKCEPSTLSTTHGKGGQDTGNQETNLVFQFPLVDEQLQINLGEACQHHKDMRQVNLPTGSLQMTQNTTVPLDDKNSEFTESFRDDGTKEIVYANGNKKVIYLNGLVVVSYYNGDRKEIHQDRTVYIYGTDHTSHTTFNDGKEVLVFPSGQKETRLPDGSSEIIFTDNSRKIISQDGIEMCIMKDGTVVRSNPDGSKVFEFVNGQREIHTLLEKRREYPDGTVKIVHRDGRTETRYKTGRTRIRDSQGNIILDSHHGL